MRKQLALTLWILLKLLTFSHAASYDNFAFPIDKSLVHNYSRLTEIKKHCSSFISLASELKSDDNIATRLKNELSFFNGDWEQDSHGATLMPFDDSDWPHAASSYMIHPLKVVSFEVQNVIFGEPNQPCNTISVSGILSIGITRNSTVISELGLKFHKRPGMSALRVDFEGLYLETEENGGERLLCLLGDSTFPFKKVPTRFTDEYMTLYFSAWDTLYNEEPVIMPHDQILLVVRYPNAGSLVNNHIRGEMTSLNKIEDFEYFDKVHITSHSGIITKEHISALQGAVLESFDQNPLKDAILEDGVNKFNNSEFCRILKYFEQKEYQVMPNLKLGGQNVFQDTVGPFLLGNEILLVDRNNGNLRMILHKINCEEDKVSGVLRMYPTTIKPHVAARRTGLSTLTLSVKGTWNSSTGLLSMTGCLGPTLVKCDSGVLLYFPKSFSSKQRSVVSGSIFSLKNATKAFLPVFIGLEMLSPCLHDNGWYSSAYLSYNYSENDLANDVKERSQEPKVMSYISKSVFQYPAVEDLKIDTFSSSETFVRVEILSIGSQFRTNDSHFYEVYDHDVLNISLNLILIENPKKVYEESYRHVSKLYLEGLYDPNVGKLYLIGCRKVDFDHVDLERGLDCLIEVTIEYSPLNTRWLINPTAMITIRSQRNEHDIYQFKPIHLHTFMIHDKNHENNVIFHKIFEGYFRVFLLWLYIAYILKRIKNMKKSSEPLAAYISLFSLGMLILGCGIALIYTKELLIKSSESEYYANHPYDLQNYKLYLNNLDYFARFLVLVSMLLVAGISQMVLKARKVLHEQGEPTPSEKKVLLVCLGAYMCYFLLMFMIKVGAQLYIAKVNLTKDVYMKIIMHFCWFTVRDLLDYALAAQIIALWVWKRRLSFPRLKHFDIGLWMPFLISFVYEFVRDPITYPM
ncbi:hypothetical protein L1987_30009 [Smallanthus sonchifolius]|uniref:Uncharacterized protein n=1 Tax=Smallanthus sonchifolius TaxID=185202 RepID=A0ACB9I1G1_9ASTR|nr:hypothetical protein L1987_30009 [Smallanthus sonchifolius]